MATEIKVPLSPAQAEMFQNLSSALERAQAEMTVFCATVFRSRGVTEGLRAIRVASSRGGACLVGQRVPRHGAA